MPGTFDPRKVQRTCTINRELFAKLMQKNERHGISFNESINMLIDNYCGKDKLSEEWKKWTADELQKVLKKRGIPESRIGIRGLGKKTLAKIASLG